MSKKKRQKKKLDQSRINRQTSIINLIVAIVNLIIGLVQLLKH